MTETHADNRNPRRRLTGLLAIALAVCASLPAPAQQADNSTKNLAEPLTQAVRRMSDLLAHLNQRQPQLTEAHYRQVVVPGCSLDADGSLDALLPSDDRHRLAAFFAARAAALVAHPTWEPDVLGRDLVFQAWDRAVALDPSQPRYRVERALARLDFDRLRRLSLEEVDATFAAAETQDRAPIDAQVAALAADDPLRLQVDYLDAQLMFHRAERDPDRARRAQLFLEAAQKLEGAVQKRPAEEKAAALVRCGDAYLRSANYLVSTDPKLGDQTRTEVRDRLTMAIKMARTAIDDYPNRAAPQHAYTLRGNAQEDFPWLLNENLDSYLIAIADFESALQEARADGNPFQTSFAHYNLGRCQAKLCYAAWRRGARFAPGEKEDFAGQPLDLSAVADAALANLTEPSVSPVLIQDRRTESFGWRIRALRFRYGSDEQQHAARRHETFAEIASAWAPAFENDPALERRVRVWLAAAQFEYARLLDPQSNEAIELEQKAVALADQLLTAPQPAELQTAPPPDQWERHADLVWIKADYALLRKRDSAAALDVWKKELEEARSAGGPRYGCLLGSCAEWLYHRGRTFRPDDPKRHDDFVALVRRDATAAGNDAKLGSGQAWARFGTVILRKLDDPAVEALRANLQAFEEAMKLAGTPPASPEALNVTVTYYMNWYFRTSLFKVPSDAAAKQKDLQSYLEQSRRLDPPRLRQIKLLVGVENLWRSKLR